MKKMPTIFERDWDGDRSRVLNKPHPDCGWVFAGEGVATRKYDGTCCLVRDEKLYKRREVKAGKPDPDDFELADYDEKTGKRIGWVPVSDDKADRWHREALSLHLSNGSLADGTYELIGPKVQGNPERMNEHSLIPHKKAYAYGDVPTDFDALREWLSDFDVEGLVWHHPDGRMAKIKLKDFGIKRPIPASP